MSIVSLEKNIYKVDPLLQKQESALDRSIIQIQAKISQTKQAHKYLSTTVTLADGTSIPQDDHIEILIERWRKAAQKASAELFVLADERVRKMGGVAEFKRRTAQRYSDFEDEVEELDEEAEERRRVLRDEYDYDVTETRKEQRAEEQIFEEEDFTMEMMLKSLNVEYLAVFPN